MLLFLLPRHNAKFHHSTVVYKLQVCWAYIWLQIFLRLSSILKTNGHRGATWIVDLTHYHNGNLTQLYISSPGCSVTFVVLPTCSAGTHPPITSSSLDEWCCPPTSGYWLLWSFWWTLCLDPGWPSSLYVCCSSKVINYCWSLDLPAWLYMNIPLWLSGCASWVIKFWHRN